MRMNQRDERGRGRFTSRTLTLASTFLIFGGLHTSCLAQVTDRAASNTALPPDAMRQASISVSVEKATVPGSWKVNAHWDCDDDAQNAPNSHDKAVIAKGDTFGEVVIKNDAGTVAWRGTVRGLDKFGRAGVRGLDISWPAAKDEAIYGLGERFDSLNQAGKHVDLWIEDAPGQGEHASRTYFSSPVVYSSKGYALFASDNPEGAFDLNASNDGLHHYQRAGKSVTFYIAISDNIIDLIDKRTAIQGRPRAVPTWSWGPWISRNSFESQAEAEEAIRGHLSRGNPIAAIVQEAWKGTSETGDFNNFSTLRWPDLDRYFALCNENGIHTVLWQVPIIHPSSPEFAEGVEKNFFVRTPDGGVSFRKEWLAGFANIDFTNPDAVKWWKDMMRPEVRRGVYGFKADDGEDIKPDDVFFDGRRGWEMHNHFSSLYAKALTELFDEEKVDGMLWARSGSLGIEKTPALWAGDQEATWQQLRSLVPAGLSTGISGQPYWSHDIGGYFGQTTPELYMRWLQLGTFSPLMQYHGNTPREPWCFGHTADDAYKLLSRIRMNLKPTLIDLGKKASESGLPIMRPLSLHYPQDARFTNEDTQYLLGSDIMVAPVLDEGATGRRVKFPEGVWHRALQPISYTGPCEVDVPIGYVDVPIFLRENANIRVQLAPEKRLGDWSNDAPTRDLRIDRQRAIVRNLKVPLIADPITRKTQIEFDVDAEQANSLQCEWYWADAPGTRHRSRLQILQKDGAQHVVADLTPPTSEVCTDRLQVYQLSSSGPVRPDAPPLQLHGEIDWHSPLSMTVDEALFNVVPNKQSSQKVRLTLKNRSSEPISVGVHAQGECLEKASTASPLINVPALGTSNVEWDIALKAAAQRVGDVRVQFTATADSLPLATAQSVFVLPGRWIIAGPFQAARRMAFASRYPAEWSNESTVGFDAGDGKIIRWNQLPEDNFVDQDRINFQSLFGKHDHAAVYAFTKIESDRDQPAELRFGSDDTLQVWLNDQNVYAVEAYRGSQPDQEIVRVALKKGINSIRVKVGQDINGWDLQYRLTAPRGAQILGVTDGFSDVGNYSADRPEPANIIRLPKSFDWRVLGPIDGLPTADRDWALQTDAKALDSAIEPGTPWKEVASPDLTQNRVDLASSLGVRSNSVAYLGFDVTSEREQEAVLATGSDDGLRVWHNGHLVYHFDEPRAFKPSSDRIPVRLARGVNTFVFRVSQVGGDWLLQADLQDQNGQPIGSEAR